MYAATHGLSGHQRFCSIGVVSVARPSAGLQVSSSSAADVVLGVFAIVTRPAGIFPDLDIPVVCGDLNSGGRALRPRAETGGPDWSKIRA
jgi:hypothetical protein